MVERKASDLFFTSNAPIKIKIEGQIYPDQQAGAAAGGGALDLLRPDDPASRSSTSSASWRSTSRSPSPAWDASASISSISAAIRPWCCATSPPTCRGSTTLGLPEVLTELAMLKRGLILLVGATGSGKSTTLAAMINHRNENASDHIVTIEDPIEFLHANKRSIINQREVGLDTKSYERALRGVMRAAPDVILIGEIRDRESMQAAINLAGTGHLVLATLHANNCAETLDRIINMFPLDQHKQVTLDLSQYLRAILAQRLVMGVDSKRVAAVEVMINTPHISELVKRGDVTGIKEVDHAERRERRAAASTAALHKLYKDGRIALRRGAGATPIRAPTSRPRSTSASRGARSRRREHRICGLEYRAVDAHALHRGPGAGRAPPPRSRHSRRPRRP